MRARFLRRDERVFARRVFGKTLPLDDILVTDLLGAGNEPFTAVSGTAGSPMPFVVPIPRYIFALNMGSEGFDNCLSPMVKSSFVRELARIWQGPMSLSTPRRTARADYQIGAPWGTLDCDQKAAVVEDWFRGGMRYDDPRMNYISEHIRRGNRA